MTEYDWQFTREEIAATHREWGLTPRRVIHRCCEAETRVEGLKRRLVKEMILTRTRTEMLEEFGPDYEQYL